MRSSRGVLVLAAVLAVVLLSGGGYAYVLSRRVQGSPERTARDYFAAWELGRLDKMARLAADPPADFAEQHRALSKGLSVTSIDLQPGPVVIEGKGSDARSQAYVDFKVTRDIGAYGSWAYRSTLRLGVAGRRWRVLWSPSTLYPGLRGAGMWKLTRIEAPGATFVARDGKPLPEDGPLQPYVAGLGEQFGESDDPEPGWAIELQQGTGKAQRLKVIGGHSGKKIRTTLDRRLQAAAENALKAGGRSGAVIVAVRPSTGEILAIADTVGESSAFLGLYPPGSTFKVVTAGALLSDGMSPGAGADCPDTVVTAQRTIRNHEGIALGGTSLRDAFAQSCNTTFARLGVERLRAVKLTAAAKTFGFDGPINPGIAAARGSFPDPGAGAELAEASIGQGRVQASPLVMALVAAAVADGTWRSPRLVDAKLVRKSDAPVQPPREVPSAAGLRAMMRAVVTDGTAARAGLPADVAGKTGTAEVGGGAPDHAWFIGYQGNLAFAVLVPGGGSGPKVAAPLAARFLKAR